MRHFRDYDLSRIMNARKMRIRPPMTIYTLIATWFFVGLIPIMPGTLGTLATYPLYHFLLNMSDTISDAMAYFMTAAVLLFFIGWWAVQKYQKVTNSFDHQSVVVDEVVGMMLTLAVSYDWLYKMSIHLYTYIDFSPKVISFFIAFLVFRFYDIKKPLFIRYIDRYYKNAFAVIIDDVLAGVFSIITIFIMYHLTEFIFSYV